MKLVQAIIIILIFIWIVSVCLDYIPFHFPRSIPEFAEVIYSLFAGIGVLTIYYFIDKFFRKKEENEDNEKNKRDGSH